MQNCLIWHHTTLVFLQALSSTEPLLVFEGGHEVHIGGRCFMLTFQNTKDFHKEICEFVSGCKKERCFSPLMFCRLFWIIVLRFAVCLLDGLSSISLVDLWWHQFFSRFSLVSYFTRTCSCWRKLAGSTIRRSWLTRDDHILQVLNEIDLETWYTTPRESKHTKWKVVTYKTMICSKYLWCFHVHLYIHYTISANIIHA